MPDKKRYTERTEVTTETTGRPGSPERDETAYRKETIVKTERTVEKDDDKVIIIDE